MRSKRFTEEQIIPVLKEGEAGAATKDLCRRHCISDQTYYRWRRKYGGLERIVGTNHHSRSSPSWLPPDTP